MKKPVVVNLFGAPGAGKSTGAAQVFCTLKKLGVNCELVTEFAKDKTWEHNMKALSCQEYVFGKQSYRFARCRDDVDVIVTDSPLPLSIIYNSNPAIEESFPKIVMDIFNTYTNINFFVNRVKPYNPKGRNQTEEESDALVFKIKSLLDKYDIPFTEINGDDDGYNGIVQDVLGALGKELN
jgi:nicotinamide riboside kinase